MLQAERLASGAPQAAGEEPRPLQSSARPLQWKLSLQALTKPLLSKTSLQVRADQAQLLH